MKCKAKIVDLEPADPGFYYPTYEYTINGKVERATSRNAIVVNPWDLTTTHTLNVNEYGEIKPDYTNGIVAVVLIFAAFFSIPVFVSIFGEPAFGLIFLFFALFPWYITLKSVFKTVRRKRAMQHLSPITGKIVWYKEVVKRRKNSTSVYHYPIVEYTYQHNTMTTQLPDSEEPVYEGENREFYLDVPHKDVFTADATKISGILGSLFPLLFTLPFLVCGVMVMIPEAQREEVFVSVIKMFNSLSEMDMNTFVPQVIPFIMLGVFAAILLPIAIRNVAQLMAMHNAKRNGQTVTARLLKTNDYGRRETTVYEYMYMGQMHKYQTTHAHNDNLDVYIHPRTHKPYSKGDFTVKYAELGVLIFMLIMVCCAAAVFAGNTI